MIERCSRSVVLVHTTRINIEGVLSTQPSVLESKGTPCADVLNSRLSKMAAVPLNILLHFMREPRQEYIAQANVQVLLLL